MAFFSFRWRSGTDRAQAEPAARPARAPQPQSVEEMRRRARHRLIGAALLVLAGVIGFPLLFDTQPRPIAVDIPIEIPDRNQTAPLTAPAASQAQAGPVSATATITPASTPAGAQQRASTTTAAAAGTTHGLAAGEELVPGNRPAASRPAAPALANAARPDARPLPQAGADAKPGAARSPGGAARALALLEGRAAAPTAASATTASAADNGRFVVQVGAFADADKLRQVRARLERAGLKTYTQVVDGKDGKDGKRTRVRVGPFASRADADRAAARIKALELPAAVLAL